MEKESGVWCVSNVGARNKELVVAKECADGAMCRSVLLGLLVFLDVMV
jgi:hypothetical protein